MLTGEVVMLELLRRYGLSAFVAGGIAAILINGTLLQSSVDALTTSVSRIEMIHEGDVEALSSAVVQLQESFRRDLERHESVPAHGRVEQRLEVLESAQVTTNKAVELNSRKLDEIIRAVGRIEGAISAGD